MQRAVNAPPTSMKPPTVVLLPIFLSEMTHKTLAGISTALRSNVFTNTSPGNRPELSEVP